MEQNTHHAARKNTKISFRTDEATFAKLKAICRTENKTVSSLIEGLLAEHVLNCETSLPIPDEKRQGPRKKCSIPVVVSTQTPTGRTYGTGVIVSISTTAMQIVLTEALDEAMLGNEFHALFSLPTKPLPLLLPCHIARTDYRHGEYVAIATLHSPDEEVTHAIEAFLGAAGRFDRQ